LYIVAGFKITPLVLSSKSIGICINAYYFSLEGEGWDEGI
jgi:hypothetical protein